MRIDSRGKSVRRSLAGGQAGRCVCVRVSREGHLRVARAGPAVAVERGRDALDGRDDLLVAKHDQVLDDRLARVGRERVVVLEQEGRQVRWELLGLLRVALAELWKGREGGIWLSATSEGPERKQGRATHLRNEGDHLAEAGALLVRVELEQAAHRLVVVPLLHELVAVAGWVALDEVLQLRQVGREEGWRKATWSARVPGPERMRQRAGRTSSSALTSHATHRVGEGRGKGGGEGQG